MLIRPQLRKQKTPAGHTAAAGWLPAGLAEALRERPGAVTTFVKRYERGGDSVDVHFTGLSPDAMRVAADHLRGRARGVLRRRGVEEIARVLDRAAEKWLDADYPPRRQAIEQIAIVTGFSEEMVAHSIDLEQKSSRYPHLMQALVNELGDPEYLDGFRPNRNLGGFTMAEGPELVGAIFSANIPALPHLEVMRAFLVKSACLGRVSAGEPIFLSLYARTLDELDPELASCLAVVYWDRGDAACEKAFLESIGHLVAYGGEAQTRRLMTVKPPALGVTWHGHKVGFTYIARAALGRGAVAEVAERVAYDFSVFDGHACLCPQICFVEEGGEVSPEEFAAACGRAMRRWAERLPPRALSLSEASRRFHQTEVLRWRDAAGEPVRVVEAPEDGAYLVVLEDVQRFEPRGGDRLLRVAPVSDFERVRELIEPLAGYLQCASVAGAEAMRGHARELAGLGVSRITPPGLMGTPSMIWHHDGDACLGGMLRWCDVELVEPETLLCGGDDLLKGWPPWP